MNKTQHPHLAPGEFKSPVDENDSTIDMRTEYSKQTFHLNSPVKEVVDMQIGPVISPGTQCLGHVSSYNFVPPHVNPTCLECEYVAPYVVNCLVSIYFQQSHMPCGIFLVVIGSLDWP